MSAENNTQTWRDAAARILKKIPATSAYDLEHDGPLTYVAHYPGDRYILRYEFGSGLAHMVDERGMDAPEFYESRRRLLQGLVEFVPKLIKTNVVSYHPDMSKLEPRTRSTDVTRNLNRGLEGFRKGFYAELVDYRPDLDEKATLVVKFLVPLTNALGDDTLTHGDTMFKRSKVYPGLLEDAEPVPIADRMRAQGLSACLRYADSHVNGLSGPEAPEISDISRPHVVGTRASLSTVHQLLLWGYVGFEDAKWPKYAGGDTIRNGVLLIDHLRAYPDCVLGVVRTLKGTEEDPDEATRGKRKHEAKPRTEIDF